MLDKREGERVKIYGKTDTGIVYDRIEPGTEFRIPPEIGEIFIGLDKYILCHFLCFLPVLYQAQGERKHIVLVTVHQSGIGLVITMQNFANEFIIILSG